jgi:hypothetical protein
VNERMNGQDLRKNMTQRNMNNPRGIPTAKRASLSHAKKIQRKASVVVSLLVTSPIRRRRLSKNKSTMRLLGIAE